jgi:hypothetical protein
MTKRLSRSRWDNFIKCPRCFYLKEKYDIEPPSQPGHPINTRVDSLLKVEFDLLRKEEKPHEIFKEYNLNFIPYNKLDPKVLAKFRTNSKGVEAKSLKTEYILFGSLDDLWFNLDTEEVVVLDYKTTSNKNLEDYTTSTKHYHKTHLRQLDFYAYLLKLNNFPIHKTGYWLICNAADENQIVFNNNLKFKTTLLPYKWNTDYIEDTLVDLEKCLENKEIPISGDGCDNCRWFKEVKKNEKENNGEYVGEFKDGKRHGKGTYTFPNGEKYVGEFKDGKFNGKGTHTWVDGAKYEGEYKDDKRHGKGTCTFPDGEKYVGEFKDDKFNGKGIYTFPNGDKYVGEFKDDKFNGKGTFTYPNGEKYVGEYKDNKRDGKGTHTFPDGKKTTGEWKDGEFVR